VENFAQIQCPWCGESFEVIVDLSVGNHQLTTDCEVCCRPMDLLIELEEGELCVRVLP
jgi:hypothetical protein